VPYLPIRVLHLYPHIRRFALYCGFAPQYGPVHPASSKPFYREAPEPFCCPLLQGNSVGGWRQALPPGLSEPWLPTGHPLSLDPPVSSPTIFTCAPGAVRHQTTAALLTLCFVVYYPTVLVMVCIDKHPQRQAGRCTPQCRLRTRRCRY
jgi:hypothetical protein